MRTVRSTLFSPSPPPSFAVVGGCPPRQTTSASTFVSENLTDSVVDVCLGELTSRSTKFVKSSFADDEFGLLDDNSKSFSDYSVCSSDISGELQRLAATATATAEVGPSLDPVPEPCEGFLERENFSTEIIESIYLRRICSRL